MMNWNLSELFSHTLDVSFQASVIILLIMIIKRVMGNRLSAGWHYGLWFMLMVRLILPESLESNISLYTLFPSPPQWGVDGNLFGFLEHASRNMAKFSKATPFPDAHPFPWLNPFTKALPFIWISVAFSMVAYIFIRSLTFLMAVRNHRQETWEPALNLLESCKKELGIKTVLVIMETDLVQSPALFGYLRPRILLPHGMIQNLDEKALRHVFLHELRHLKHHDILIGLIASILLALHWFNPLVWMAFHAMKRDREFACDAMTLSHLKLPEHREYGLVLLNLASGENGKIGKNPFHGLTGIMEYKSEIKRRIEMIAAFKKRSPWYTLVVTTCYLLLGLTVLTSAQIPASKSQQDLALVSTTLVELLVQEAYGQVTRHYDATMAQALPPEKLKAVWEDLITKTGTFKEIKATRSSQYGDFEIIFVTCDFNNGPLDIKFVFNQESKVSGMWFVPTQQ
jgi:bla regulator protein BlaR1